MKRTIGKLLSDARRLGNLKVATLCSIVLCAQLNIVINQRRSMQLVNNKVRDNRLELERRARRNRAAAAMDLHADVVHMGVVADLLSLRYASDVT